MPTLSRLTRDPVVLTPAIAVIGFLGAALVARASYVVGTLPGHHLDRAASTGPYRWLYEIGVAVMVVAWLALGRLVLDETISGMKKRVCWVGAAMIAPLLFSAPLTSQDVWAYLGQGEVAAHGLDPYSLGPGSVPGPYADAVAREWVSAPSQYGPLWMWLSRLAVEVTRPHLWAGMVAFRALALAGMVIMAVALARLCRATGARPEAALWLTVAGPFPLLMLVGGLHNDALMLALMVGGVAVAASAPTLRRGLLLGAGLVGAAGAIKVTALVALPFLPLLWFRYAAEPDGESKRRPPAARRWVAGGALSTVVGVATLLGLCLVTGFGLGWVPHLGDGEVGVAWLSVPSQVGDLVHHVAPDQVADRPGDRDALVHPVSLGFLALSGAAVTLTARRRPPLLTLAVMTALLVAGSAAPRTWYLLWPLVFLAADRMTPRLLAAVVAASAALALWFPPAVRPSVSPWVLLALVVVLTGVTLAFVPGRRRSQPSPDPLLQH